MLNNTITFLINIKGNAQEGIVNLSGSAQEMTKNVSKFSSMIDNIGIKMFKFNEITQGVQNLATSIRDIYQPGVELNTSLADLSAITGETGEGLQKIDKYARETAKTFGGSAAQSVESYKLLLSQLTPELSKSPEALQKMGNSIAVLSKTMGGDTVAAAEVLTTAMNQFQISMEDPIAASKEMATMMNVMAAAAMEGSAELPQIKLALENTGMAAKAAGVNFAETNAAIQVLDKAGKKGAEGGVALRNVMMILSRGRFLPPNVQEELEAAGVDIATLTDKSLSLTERLRPLKGVMNDTALITKLFGMENANAATALLSQLDEVDRLTGVIQGTNTAVDQANIVMESYAERQSRIQAQFDDIKTSIFNTTGDSGIWIQTVASAMIPISQLVPLIARLAKGIGFLATGVRNLIGRIDFSVLSIHRMRIQFQMMAIDIKKGEMANLGFTRNVIRATMAVGRFATVGLANAVKGIVQYTRSLVAGGASSMKFALLSRASFATFRLSAVSACRAVGVTIKSIPIIGWVAAATAAVIGLIRLFRRTKDSVDEMSESFRNAQDAANSYYSDERMNLDMMFAKLSQTNPKSKERKKLVSELKDLYPDLNDEILKEITNTNNLSIAYDAIITKIAARAKLEAMQSLLKEKYMSMAAMDEKIYTYVDMQTRLFPDKSAAEIRNEIENELLDTEAKGKGNIPIQIGTGAQRVASTMMFNANELRQWQQQKRDLNDDLNRINNLVTEANYTSPNSESSDINPKLYSGENNNDSNDAVSGIEALQESNSGILMGAIDGIKNIVPKITVVEPNQSNEAAAGSTVTYNTDSSSVSNYQTDNDNRVNNETVTNECNVVSNSTTNEEGDSIENNEMSDITIPVIHVPDYTSILSEIGNFVSDIFSSVSRIFTDFGKNETAHVVADIKETQDINVISMPGQSDNITNNSDNSRSITKNVTIRSLIGNNTNMFNQAEGATADDFMELLRQVLITINSDFKLA